MKFKKAQTHYLLNQTNRDIFLKARQLGITTLSVIDMLDDCVVIPNTVCGLIAHTREDVQKIFRIAKIAYENLPDNFKPTVKYDNKNELYFADHNSLFYVAVKIRGGTVNKLHFSEAAHIKNFDDVYAASAESVPQDGVIRVETTAKGLGGPYFSMWNDSMGGGNDYAPHFYGWNWDDEYIRSAEGIEFEQDERNIQEQYSLTDEQLSWYRWKKSNLKRLFQQEYPINPDEAFIASGGNRFNIELLKKLSQVITKPIDISLAEKFKFLEQYVKIWKMPEKGKRYVMGSDCSKGSQSGDWQVSAVLEFETGEQVAELRTRIDIGRFTELSMLLGELFNNALWGIELQDHGFTALNIAKKTYKNLFARRKQTSKGTNDKELTELGWSTNGSTKPVMIDELDIAMVDGNIKMNSQVLISECMTYLEEPDGKTNAAERCHDDTVIAAAIAYQMRKYLRPETMISKEKPEGL